MTSTARAYRSFLYIPGSKDRALEKARSLPADAIIFDLEDAVAPDEKARARTLLRDTLSDSEFGSALRIVRVNGLDTPWSHDDVAAFGNLAAADAILVPKVNRAADLDAIVALGCDRPLWAMMETALGVLNAAEIAAHSRLQGMVMGTNDLAKELGSRSRPDRLAMQASLGLCLLAARAHGRVIVDGVFNAFSDTAGLQLECDQGRDMGFDGKTLIHPAQLEIANAAFAPSEADIALARRQIEAFERAVTNGQGVAVLDGHIVENLRVETARTTLDKARAIGLITA